MNGAGDVVRTQPSWRWPIFWGAAATFVLHGPVAVQHTLWVIVFGVFGATGLLLGIVPVWSASRRERLGTMSGFALGFIASGLGMIALVLLTVMQGFVVTPAEEEMWRQALLEQDVPEADVDTFLSAMHGSSGSMMAVLASTCVAFTAGFSGGITALLRARGRP